MTSPITNERYRVELKLRKKIMKPEAGPDAFTYDDQSFTVTYGKTGDFRTAKKATDRLLSLHDYNIQEADEADITVWNGANGKTVWRKGEEAADAHKKDAQEALDELNDLIQTVKQPETIFNSINDEDLPADQQDTISKEELDATEYQTIPEVEELLEIESTPINEEEVKEIKKIHHETDDTVHQVETVNTINDRSSTSNEEQSLNSHPILELSIPNEVFVNTFVSWIRKNHNNDLADAVNDMGLDGLWEIIQLPKPKSQNKHIQFLFKKYLFQKLGYRYNEK